jgi:hypothetical protein
MGLFRLAADKVAHIFGVRVTKRLRGKLHRVLEKLDHGHHVLRIYCKNLVGRMYQKFSNFLRVEVCVNRMKDLGLNRGLKHLGCLRQKLIRITDPFAGFEVQSLNVHVDFSLIQRIALPVTAGKTKIAGIRIHDTGMADGGVAPRRHATQRMAIRRCLSSHPHYLRSIRQHLHSQPTSL